LFNSLLEASDYTGLASEFPTYPLNAPGLPLPGPDFINHAVSLGDSPAVVDGKATSGILLTWGPRLETLYRRALYDDQFTMPVIEKGKTQIARLVTGHLIGDSTKDFGGGPRPARVMIVTKAPGKDETATGRLLVGDIYNSLVEVFRDLGVTDVMARDFYVTSICKWGALSPTSDALPQAHVRDCAMLLQQELRLVRPDFILCLGSDAGKWFLGTGGSVTAMVGRTAKYAFATQMPGEPSELHTATVVVCPHPAAVHSRPEMFPDYREQLTLFQSIINGAEVGGFEKGIKHRNVYKQRELKQIVDRIRADPDPRSRIIAVDGEWQGDHPFEPGAYLRTIQFSAADKEAYCVVLRHQGGSEAFKPNIAAAIHELTRLLKNDPENNYYPRPGGHFFRADLPFLKYDGLDLLAEYAPPDSPSKARSEGGWDTSHMVHAHNETASYRLTDVMVRFTTAPVYDVTLKAHIVDYCKRNDIKKEVLEGYGFLPNWILHPEITDPEGDHNYSAYDADSTRRVAMRFMSPGGELDSDWFGNPSWEPYWLTHTASLGVLQMEMTGLTLDKPKVDALTTMFMMVHSELLADFRAKINWPDFNPESVPHCVAFMFGDTFGFKTDPETKMKLPVRPEGATTLNLTPITTTGKRPKLWEVVVRNKEQDSYAPSTNKEVLGILGHEHPLAMQLRDLKFISQVLKGALRRPNMTEDGAGWDTDENGDMLYDKGVPGSVCADGKVRTHISQNKETGRYSSARPNLQAISKKRESDYARICGVWKEKDGTKIPKGDYVDVLRTPRYLTQIRSIFKASPGCVLVEADYIGAELAAIGWLSGDINMIDRCRRNCLSPNDPDYFEMHSRMAVKAFRLTCPPTKKGLEDAGVIALRVAAKNIAFGLPYGRKADAITRQCHEEGANVTLADCQQLMDAYFEDYPQVAEFLERAKARSQNERWLAGTFGRLRRFMRTKERSVIGEQERQACNYGIQNCVADGLTTAISNFYRYQLNHADCSFVMSLPIHDALLFNVRIDSLDRFCNDTMLSDGTVERSVLRRCMVDEVPIRPRDLNNLPLIGAPTYNFGIDVAVQLNWGTDITADQASELGIDLENLHL